MPRYIQGPCLQHSNNPGGRFSYLDGQRRPRELRRSLNRSEISPSPQISITCALMLFLTLSLTISATVIFVTSHAKVLRSHALHHVPYPTVRKLGRMHNTAHGVQEKIHMQSAAVVFNITIEASSTVSTSPQPLLGTRSPQVIMSTKITHKAWHVIADASNLRNHQLSTSSLGQPNSVVANSTPAGGHSSVASQRENLSLAESRALLDLFLTQILPSNGASKNWTSCSPYLLPHELQQVEAKHMLGLLHQLWAMRPQKHSPPKATDSAGSEQLCPESKLIHQLADASKGLNAMSCGQPGSKGSSEGGDGLTYVLMRRLSVAMLLLLHGEEACGRVLAEV